VPTVLLAAASHVPVAATLTATLFLAPLALVLTAGIGAKVVRDERARQLAHRRQLAKAATRRYLDEVMFRVGRDCQQTLTLTQRQLRDEFHERALQVHRSSTVTLEAAQRARDLGGPERDHRASALDRRARQLRELQQAVESVASAVPPGVGRG
jgi:hypothetical protein